MKESCSAKAGGDVKKLNKVMRQKENNRLPMKSKTYIKQYKRKNIHNKNIPIGLL
jgi:hypothetical protein|tara:strand:+ start:2455 stop:2619 length:165 start_codon:yes stop_codon:yes gene_type:complete